MQIKLFSVAVQLCPQSALHLFVPNFTHVHRYSTKLGSCKYRYWVGSKDSLPLSHRKLSFALSLVGHHLHFWFLEQTDIRKKNETTCSADDECTC